MPPTLEAWSLNHWTAREVPLSFFFFQLLLLLLWIMCPQTLLSLVETQIFMGVKFSSLQNNFVALV